MAVNLSRNTKVFFSTNTDDVLANYTAANTFELQVLDGYTFSQNTEQQTITLSEAGTAPVRGERAFNSKLNPVEWSLSTYIRPYKPAAVVTAPEKFFWNAIMGSKAIDATGTTGWTGGAVALFNGSYCMTLTKAANTVDLGDMVRITGTTVMSGSSTGNGYFRVVDKTGNDIKVDLGVTIAPTGSATVTSSSVFAGQWHEESGKAVSTTLGSNKNELQKFTLIFKVDSTVYKIANCAINQAELSFDLQGISMIAWSGFGTTLTSPATLQAWAVGNATIFPTTADNYITNKLSTTTLVANLGGTGTGNTTYSVPITGGNLTINNNIEYLTPENMGAVNTSIGYFTGTRSITGSLNAYLKTGTNESAKLLTDILSNLATTSETKFKLQIEVGGASNSTRVDLLMEACQLQVPTVDIQDVVSTTINFSAQGYSTLGVGADPGSYDIEKTNNLVVSYYGVV
jgi:hypothetical protein